MNIDYHQYPKCPWSLRDCAEKVEVEMVVVVVVEGIHQMMNYHSVSTRSSYTWTSSFVPWIASAASIPPFPSCVAHAASCTSYPSPRAASVLIHLAHAPNLRYLPYQPQQTQLQTQRLKNMSYYSKQSPCHISNSCCNHQPSGSISHCH